ncbi:MAG TPA: isoprenylcysteine carboxylmethyltransferase family protein [Chloroflexia bacterium]
MAIQQMPAPTRGDSHPATGPDPEACTPAFLAGDIIVFGSTGDLFSNLSRWMMRGRHEEPTYAVHTGQFLDSQRVLEMAGMVGVAGFDTVLNRRYWHGPFRGLCPPAAWAQLYTVLNRRFGRGGRTWQGLWKARGFEVWRSTRLTDTEREALTREALKYLDVKFGFAKLWAHTLDDLICKLLRRDVFLFRHIDPEDRHPVCSGVTAAVYDRALHYRFGVDPECVDPDQIHDWVQSPPDEWVCVFRASSEALAGDREMGRKMSVMGVGGEIAVPTLLYTAGALAVSRRFRPKFRITRDSRALRLPGILLVAGGFSLNLAAAAAMLKAHQKDRLATGGLYRLFRDPMYVLQIFLTLPGLFLLFNSWLVLAGVLPAYLAYRVFVREEHRYLADRFGEAYREYLKTVLLKV